ncbi:MAG: glycosyltransferase family 4 protein [Gemmatimonadaceae bacterium]
MLTELYADKSQYQENLLGKYYVKHGHEVTVIAGTSNDARAFYADEHDATVPASEYRDGGVNVIKLPYSLNFLNRLRRFAGVDEILEREQPDLIYVHDIHLNLAEAASYKKKYPHCTIIMDYHADYSNSAKNWLSLHVLHKVIRKAILYRSRKYIARFYPVWPAAGVFLNEVYGIAPDEMELLHQGPDTDLARSTKAARAGAAVRHRLGIPDDAVVVFTGGKFNRKKKTHLLIDAVMRIARRDLHLIAVGDAGPADQEYKAALLRSCAGSERIHLVGWQHGADVYRFMDASDFAVFPASQSVLWQQAISMGLPLIVGHDDGQDASHMNMYGNVVILDEADITVEVIAARIQAFLDDRALLERLQRASLRTADERFDFNKIALQTLRLADAAVRERSEDGRP